MAAALEPQEEDVGDEQGARGEVEMSINVTNVGINDDNGQDADFAHLTEREKSILKRQIDVLDTKVGLTTMFGFATRNDLIVIYISGICAMIGGGILPIMSVSLSTSIFKHYPALMNTGHIWYPCAKLSRLHSSVLG